MLKEPRMKASLSAPSSPNVPIKQPAFPEIVSSDNDMNPLQGTRLEEWFCLLWRHQG